MFGSARGTCTPAKVYLILTAITTLILCIIGFVDGSIISTITTSKGVSLICSQILCIALCFMCMKFVCAEIAIEVAWCIICLMVISSIAGIYRGATSGVSSFVDPDKT